MDFDVFLALVPKIIQEKLPDDVSHQKMAPLERMEIMKNLDLEKATYTGNGLTYLWFRIPLQLFFIAWVWYFALFN